MNWAFNIGYINGYRDGFYNRYNDFYSPNFCCNNFVIPFFNFTPSFNFSDFWCVQRQPDIYRFDYVPYFKNDRYLFGNYSDFGYKMIFNNVKKSTKSNISNSKVSIRKSINTIDGKTSEKDKIFLGHKVTSGFGVRIHPVSGKRKKHNGIDLTYSNDEAVYSFTDGKVTYVGYEKNGYGNWIEITDVNGVKHRYAHANKIIAQKGQEVKAGELIMKAGSTGQSTGPHVHYETIVNGEKVNPFTTWA